MSCAREMIEFKKKLEELGHLVKIPEDAEKHLNGKITDQDKWEKLEFNVFKSYFQEIKEGDAVLIINKDKNNISNYIGGNSLIEMAFAHVLDKKIFLLNTIPLMSYTNEIEAMNPIILNGDLNKI